MLSMHDKHASPNVKSSFIDIQMIPDVEIINQLYIQLSWLKLPWVIINQELLVKRFT
jgi:hypothetical protein